MSFDPFSAALELGQSAIERIWPDPIRRAEEMRKLKELEQNGNLAEMQAHVQLMLAQIKVNEKAAEHKSVFVAGPRPFILWIGGIALAWQFILYPMLLWPWAILQARGYIPADLPPPPVLDASQLFAIVMSLLGVGAMRSFDKKNKTETNSIRGDSK